jgi:multidrug efflux pump subunit AcrA (membrane-fusion protein)
VNNPSLRLAPGMLPQVSWPTRRLRPSLLVPASAVTVTTERSFVIRIWDGIAEWVDVTRDASVNQYGTDMVEVFGELAPGDRIAVRGTDELRAGTLERRAADDGGELRPIVADQADPLHVEVVHAPTPRLVPGRPPVTHRNRRAVPGDDAGADHNLYSLYSVRRTSAARSPMMTQGAMVLPVVTRGKIDPSAMRRLSMP